MIEHVLTTGYGLSQHQIPYYWYTKPKQLNNLY